MYLGDQHHVGGEGSHLSLQPSRESNPAPLNQDQRQFPARPVAPAPAPVPADAPLDQYGAKQPKQPAVQRLAAAVGRRPPVVDRGGGQQRQIISRHRRQPLTALQQRTPGMLVEPVETAIQFGPLLHQPQIDLAHGAGDVFVE